MDDIAYLITESAPTYDEYGNEIMTRVESQVFVQERSVTRSEFYTAAQVGLHPSIVLRISHRLDYEGQKLVYKEDHDGQTTTGLLFLAAVFFFFIIYRKYYTLRTAGEQRDKQLERDYPDLIAKLLILVRAGMPVKSAWIHMTEDYRKNKKKDGVVHYAYEEMIGSVKLMESGIGEGKAYTEFGRRCGGHMYLKLGSLLEQNIKKGSTGMAQVLDGERVQALENRRRQIRSSGEAAGTQLMMPMMIMFILVMAIIMVPALSSF